MKYGVQLYSLRETAEKRGAEEVLRLVAEAGYDGVEFAGFYGRTPEEMKALLAEYGLVHFRAHPARSGGGKPALYRRVGNQICIYSLGGHGGI